MNTLTSGNSLGLPAIPAKFRQIFDESTDNDENSANFCRTSGMLSTFCTIIIIRKAANVELGAVQKRADLVNTFGIVFFSSRGAPRTDPILFSGARD